MKDKNNIENWYKSIVENNDEFPPEVVWEEVQDELDIKGAWSGISSVLNQQKRRNLVFALSLAASFILLLGFGGYLIYFSNISINENKFFAKEKVEDLQPINIIETEESFNVIVADNSVQESIVVKETMINDSIETIKNEFSDEIIVENIAVSKSSISPIIYDKVVDVLGNKQIAQLSAPLTKSIMSEKFEEGTKGFSNLHIGLTGQFANTWMINNKTITGLDKDEFITTNFSFGKNLGVSIGTNINENLFLRSELFWLSEQKQSYDEYINGRYVSNTLAINYYSVLLRMNYKIKRSRLEHYFAFGGYIDVMQNATQDINGNLKDIKEEYSNIDYGVFLGYEYPIKITSSLYFVPGIGAKVGLNNVFSGNELVPDYLNKTRNTSVNLSFSLIYSVF